jgi:hypothetical protein
MGLPGTILQLLKTIVIMILQHLKCRKGVVVVSQSMKDTWLIKNHKAIAKMSLKPLFKVIIHGTQFHKLIKINIASLL